MSERLTDKNGTERNGTRHRRMIMLTRSIHGTAFHHFDPTLWCELVSHDGYIKYHYSDYSEIPIGILKTRLRESKQYLVRNAIRIEIANRQMEDWLITGNK